MWKDNTVSGDKAPGLACQLLKHHRSLTSSLWLFKLMTESDSYVKAEGSSDFNAELKIAGVP